MDLKKFLSMRLFNDPMTILRIWVGIAFIIHGFPVFNSGFMEGQTAFLESYQIPMPELMAYLSKAGELIAGVLLLFGLFTRFAAFIIIVDMMVATFQAMGGEIFGDFQGEMSFTYLIIAIALFLCGPTFLSLDQKFFGVPSM